MPGKDDLQARRRPMSWYLHAVVISIVVFFIAFAFAGHIERQNRAKNE